MAARAKKGGSLRLFLILLLVLVGCTAQPQLALPNTPEAMTCSRECQQIWWQCKTAKGCERMDVLSGALCEASCNTERTRCLTTCPGAQWVNPTASVVRVTEIELGTAVGPDKRVLQPTTVFKPRDTLFASVSTDGASPRVTLTAHWSYEATQLVNESSQVIAPNGPAVTEFHLTKPDGWPPGRYRLEVLVDGQLAGTRDFEVGP